MTESEKAADHLRVIRTLMQRSTTYRAISGPAAVVGGVAAVIAVLAISRFDANSEAGISTALFYGIWVAILIVLTVFNLWLLKRQAAKRSEPLLSAGLKTAAISVAPPMFAGGVISWLWTQESGNLPLCAAVWVLFYSLALLSLTNFAPRSMRWLGRGFFLAAIVVWVALFQFEDLGRWKPIDLAGLIMAATFGLLHIVYGAYILIRKKEELDEPA